MGPCGRGKNGWGGVSGLPTEAWPEQESPSGSQPLASGSCWTGRGLAGEVGLLGIWEGNDEGRVLEPSPTSMWNLRSSLIQPVRH